LNTQRVTARPSQQYGERAAAENAQRAVPLPAMPAPGDPSVALGAPTQRPDEPVTAGLPFGPGPGPEVLPASAGVVPDPGQPDQAKATLVALYQKFQYPELLDMIEELDRRGY
jgi:hypothetical protein